jgi:mono/diheme cytochrome c family protein/rhodanese-related sulfurtransferase
MLAPVVRAAGVFALLGALGCSSASKPNEVPPSGDAMEHGKALYDKYCKLCHGDAGVGYAADNASALANKEFLATASDHFIYVAVEKGRPDTPMAAFGEILGGPLNTHDINSIIAYLRSLSRGPAVELVDKVVDGDLERGRAVFDEQCARCHGPQGGGKSALSLNNPLFLATASDAFIRYAIEHGRSGTPMPSFGSKLSAQSIDDVTRLVRSWARNVEQAPVGEPPPLPEQVVLNPSGPTPEFTLREGRYVPAEEVKKAFEKKSRMVILDARPMSDWLKSHIPGAAPVPFYAGIDEIVKALPRDGTWIVAYCACPHAASGKVVDLLREAGFKNTAVLDEGILIWTQRGYPLTFGVPK